VIGFLKLIGVLNAAVWFGAAVFFVFGASPAVSSSEMRVLLGAKSYPYFSGAISQVIVVRYFQLQFVCGSIALLHLVVEWLYLGRIPHKFWRGLLLGLVAANLLSGLWLQPRLRTLHRDHYAANLPLVRRAQAARAFNNWQSVGDMINFLTVGGLAFYLWRVANPPDPTRFVSATKFRG
jgi:hypothetical protein